MAFVLYVCMLHPIEEDLYAWMLVFSSQKKNLAWSPFDWIHREFYKNLQSAYQDDWCCPLEQNGYYSWTIGQLLTWVNAEHRGFMSQKPETQCRKEHYTALHHAFSCENVSAEFLKLGIHFHLFYYRIQKSLIVENLSTQSQRLEITGSSFPQGKLISLSNSS